ncbi:hypothetical protein ACHHYP_03204 [Achlya hypogyna]|uniref:SLC26A/SulP transporter domain-containing protein n=1 Tax=Achlya hypogyna TaxID=1202772 RepID=A0A1V9Z456_ACHHY|nr:hypothetical protein ACHHYP_03204 [Achlya hypogyna]
MWAAAWRHVRIALAETMPILEWLPSYAARRHLAHDLTTAVVLACLILPEDVFLASTLHVTLQNSNVLSVVVPVLYGVFGSARYLCFGSEEATSFAPWILTTYESETHRRAVGLVLTTLSGLLLVCMGLAKVSNWIYLSRVAGGGLLAGAMLRILVSEVQILAEVVLVLLPSEPLHVAWLGVLAVGFGAVAVRYRRALLPHTTAACRADKVAPRRSSLTVHVAAVPSRRVNFDVPNTVPLSLCVVGALAHHWLAEPKEMRAMTAARATESMNVATAFAFVLAHASSSLSMGLHIASNVVLSALSIYLSATALTQHAGGATTKLTNDDAFGELSMNKELVGYGLVCLCSLAFGPLFPPVACLARTALVMRFGRTQVASMAAAGLVAAFTASGLDAFVFVPAPARAAIFLIGISQVCDITELRTLLRLHLVADAAVWTTCCAAAAVLGVYYGSLTAFALSVTQRLLLAPIVTIEAVEEELRLATTEHDDKAPSPRTYVALLKTKALCFSNWDRMERTIDTLLEATDLPTTRSLVVDVRQLEETYWDDECIRRLDAWQRRLHMLGLRMAIAGSTKGFEVALERAGVLRRLVRESACHSSQAALEAVRALSLE